MDEMDTRLYTVTRAFRVGRSQRWLKPGDQPVNLLACEALYPLQMGWLRPFDVTTESQPLHTMNNQNTLNTHTAALSAANVTTTEE